MLNFLKSIFFKKNIINTVEREKSIKEKFDEYCDNNPEADECREYDV